MFWTQIQTLDPPDPKGLGPGLGPKFLDPTDLIPGPGLDLGLAEPDPDPTHAHP